MQISKCFLVVCAAAFCVAILPLRAADADTDTKLREALEKKLNELQMRPGGRPTPAGAIGRLRLLWGRRCASRSRGCQLPQPSLGQP